MVEINESERKKEKRIKRNEDNLRDLQDNIKCPKKHTKEEEIGNITDNEFQIMIVKIIQSLENKMELETNSLETRIEKMQEGFNKDLVEIKKSQYIMNNVINEIKNTLEGTNSRITAAEDRISEVEDRMIEINEAERKKKNELKEMRTISETSGTMLNTPP